MNRSKWRKAFRWISRDFQGDPAIWFAFVFLVGLMIGTLLFSLLIGIGVVHPPGKLAKLRRKFENLAENRREFRDFEAGIA